ncbi:MAG: DUF5004 domain-containing protein [Bacteroidota bacterium]
MKKIRYILSIVALSSLVTFMSCGDDDSSGPSDTDRLAGAWSGTSVTLDNFDVTSPEYSNFRITFNADGSYITIDGDPVFTDTGGFWTITSSSATGLGLTLDGVAAQAAFNADNTTLTLTFTATNEVIGARTSGLAGSYVFSLAKQ